MSSEVCPFCGKTFKRLKSHLPHCKAAANSQTPPTTQDATVLSKTTTKEKKPKQLSPMATDQPPKKSKKVSAHASQSEQLTSTLMANKKKQKKLKETASSASPSSDLPKPEKKSLRALIEEAKPVASVKETRSASKDSSLSKSSNQTETKVAPESFHDANVFSGTKVKKQPKMKDVVCGWNSLDSNLGPDQSGLRRIKENVWVDGDGEDKEGLTDVGGHRGKVTLQDVKSTLGRAASRRQSSILSRITAADQMKLDVDPSPLPVETQKQETTQSDKQLSVKESGAPPSVQHQLLSSAAQGGRSRLAEPLLSAPSNQLSSHLQFPRMVEDLQLDVRKQNQLIEGRKFNSESRDERE
ncbi:PREDICTED: uncharacterized protein C17orf80 homolog [Cyprinodon variegatus]|uniref:uncharacterized protein C17orf80 homolog n=1 Tax=Cyprinodon variegatus TaxID=28743 RepID=UPI0007429B4A|nr:PREDICTED: uncharacterized protein C17orf80 homolog [Cyprinodon variegatus]